MWAHLHGVVGVLVVEDEGLLDELVLLLQQVQVGLVVHNAALVLLQVIKLVFQSSVHLDGDAPDLLQGGDPGDTSPGCCPIWKACCSLLLSCHSLVLAGSLHHTANL